MSGDWTVCMMESKKAVLLVPKWVQLKVCMLVSEWVDSWACVLALRLGSWKVLMSGDWTVCTMESKKAVSSANQLVLQWVDSKERMLGNWKGIKTVSL